MFSRLKQHLDKASDLEIFVLMMIFILAISLLALLAIHS